MVNCKNRYSFFYCNPRWSIFFKRPYHGFPSVLLIKLFLKTAGSTTVTDLPDIKNIINVPAGHGEMEREAAKALPNDQLLEILSTVPTQTITKIAEKLTYVNEKVALYKTISNKSKTIQSLERSLEGAKKIK